MKINLLPKENRSKPQYNTGYIWIILLVSLIVFSFCFYLGYLFNEISNLKTRSEQLSSETKCYNTQYHKVINIESALEQIKAKNKYKLAIRSHYLPPLNMLETLIQLKPDLIWYEKIEFNGTDGNFILTGGASDYKVLVEFIGKLEQDRLSFSQIKPENAVINTNGTGREYVKFIISGIVTKRSETNVKSD